MPKEIISRKTQSNLEILNQAGVLNGYYLAGGTGLALQLKHRLSPLKKINNALVASLGDIACMKIDAISSKGEAKKRTL